MDSVQNTVAGAKDSVAQSVQSGTEPPSGQGGAGTVDSPYDSGNAPENPPAAASASNPDSSLEPQQGSGSGSTQAQKVQNPVVAPEAIPANNPSITTTSPPTAGSGSGPTDSADSGGNFDAAKRDAGLRMERDVSPGTRDDGSHATTSGDKGETYQPQGKMGKLKGKFGFGKS